MAQQTAESNVTTNHDTIRKWAEARNGKPARVKGTGGQGSADVLRIDFPGREEVNLEPVGWNEFFQAFEENDLAFLYQEETKEGGTSRFNKFVDRASSVKAGSSPEASSSRFNKSDDRGSM